MSPTSDSTSQADSGAATKTNRDAKTPIAVSIDPSTVLPRVFIRLDRTGVMSIPEAARLVEELSETLDFAADAKMPIAMPITLATVIVLVFALLAMKGVMSIPEAVYFVNELSEGPHLSDNMRQQLHFVMSALLNLDIGPERLWRQ